MRIKPYIYSYSETDDLLKGHKMKVVAMHNFNMRVGTSLAGFSALAILTVNAEEKTTYTNLI